MQSCQAYYYEEDNCFKCENLTNEQLCEDCSEIKDDRGVRCRVFKSRFRCIHKTNSDLKICGSCDIYGNAEEWLEEFYLTRNHRSFEIYLNDFTWKEKTLKTLCKRMASKKCQEILLNSSQFNDLLYLTLIKYKRFHPKLLSRVLERFFLIKQIIMPDLVAQLMIPYTIRFSPRAIWEKYFTGVFESVEEQNESFKKVDFNIVKFIDYLAEEGYKKINMKPEIRHEIIEIVKSACLIEFEKPRTRAFIYAIKSIK
jgi:hypothetical protein